MVLVQFTERVRVNDEWVEKPCNWTVDGIDRPGVYPISPCRRHWFLDERRKPPKLRVIRHQLPPVPAYAMTAHCAQGRTLPAAIIDLQIGRGVNGIASYVAMTRVRKKTDLLIFRPFDREVFAAGPPLGPSLLLQHLKGEFIDWKQIEEDHIPTKFCHGPCRSMRFKDDFWKGMVKQDRSALLCVYGKIKVAGTPWRCFRCRAFFPKADFLVSIIMNLEKKTL